MNGWLRSARNRLESAGFVILDDLSFDGRKIAFLARRSRFEWTKFGMSETFFTFAEFEHLTTQRLRNFSAVAYQCAIRHKTVPLPCGFFECVWSYAVAVAEDVDPDALTSVQRDTPPMHWASAEIPAVYDLGQRDLFYFEQTPLWGSAYWAGFRREIDELLGTID